MKSLIYFFIALVLLTNCKREVVLENKEISEKKSSNIEAEKESSTLLNLHEKITVVGNFYDQQDDPIKTALRRMAIKGWFAGIDLTELPEDLRFVKQKPEISIDINQNFICFIPVDAHTMEFNFPIDTATFDFNHNLISVFEADGSLLLTIEIVDKDHFRVHEYAGWLWYGEGFQDRENWKNIETRHIDGNLRASFVDGKYWDETRLYNFRYYLGK